MTTVRRVLTFIAALVTSIALVAEPVAADPVSDEHTFVAKINALRAAHGMRPVETNAALTNAARVWAYAMANDGYISHRRDLSVGAPSDWEFLGENVGVGGDVHSLHDAFVASPTHLANLLNPRFDSVGIGVVQVGSVLWVAQEFMQTGAPVMTQSVARPVIKKTTVVKKKRCTTRRCRRARKRIVSARG
jgi:uncharacterized protein YkwD